LFPLTTVSESQNLLPLLIKDSSNLCCDLSIQTCWSRQLVIACFKLWVLDRFVERYQEVLSVCGITFHDMERLLGVEGKQLVSSLFKGGTGGGTMQAQVQESLEQSIMCKNCEHNSSELQPIS
jgi:hypothetical protein